LFGGLSNCVQRPFVCSQEDFLSAGERQMELRWTDSYAVRMCPVMSGWRGGGVNPDGSGPNRLPGSGSYPNQAQISHCGGDYCGSLETGLPLGSLGQSQQTPSSQAGILPHLQEGRLTVCLVNLQPISAIDQLAWIQSMLAEAKTWSN
jgi:hypothetical protein